MLSLVALIYGNSPVEQKLLLFKFRWQEIHSDGYISVSLYESARKDNGRERVSIESENPRDNGPHDYVIKSRDFRSNEYDRISFIIKARFIDRK